MCAQLRLFVGIDIGDIWTERLTATRALLGESLGDKGRWVRPELYHVTVVFLGNQPEEAVERIEAALSAAAAEVEPFPLRLTAVQRLGGHAHAALVAGVDDPTRRLQRYRAQLDDQLRQQGIAFDSKRLVPHVTLLRPRRRSGPLPLTPVDLRDAPPLTVSEVNLVRSDLLPTGPRYSTLGSARFR